MRLRQGDRIGTFVSRRKLVRMARHTSTTAC
jgi:hypothetical protein